MQESNTRLKSISTPARAASRAWRPATTSTDWKKRRRGDRLACCTVATVSSPVMQHVTTACHHCVEPACLRGLPGRGLREGSGHRNRAASRRSVHRLPVLHSEVPVRRSQIQPREGNRPQVRHVPATAGGGRGAGVRAGLPESGDSHHGRRPRGGGGERRSQPVLARRTEPGYTLPTTIYKTRKPLPPNLLPADYYSAAPQHAHWPLVFMLVLTQMSVGAFLVDHGIASWLASAAESAIARSPMVHLAAAFVLGCHRTLRRRSFTWAGRGWRIARSSAGEPLGSAAK